MAAILATSLQLNVLSAQICQMKYSVKGGGQIDVNVQKNDAQRHIFLGLQIRNFVLQFCCPTLRQISLLKLVWRVAVQICLNEFEYTLQYFQLVGANPCFSNLILGG